MNSHLRDNGASQQPAHACPGGPAGSGVYFQPGSPKVGGRLLLKNDFNFKQFKIKRRSQHEKGC